MKRKRLSVPLVMLFILTLFSPMLAANAASVDWVVNVTTDKTYYEQRESPTVTVQIANRGTEDATAPAKLQLTSDLFTDSTTVVSYTCTSTGGASCDTVKLVKSGSNNVITATLPPLTTNQTITLVAELSPWTQAGSKALTASIMTGNGDVEATDGTNVSVQTPSVTPVEIEHSVSILNPVKNLTDPAPSAKVEFSNDSPKYTTDVELNASASYNNKASLEVVEAKCIEATGLATCDGISSSYGGMVKNASGVWTVKDGYDLVYNNLPPDSTVVMEYTFAIPYNQKTFCALPGDSTVGKVITRASIWSSDSTPENNSDSAEVTYTLPACPTGDLYVEVTQSQEQMTNGLKKNSPWEYTYTFGNKGTEDLGVASASISLNQFLVGTLFKEGQTLADRPDIQYSCTATGGAVCPTKEEITLQDGASFMTFKHTSPPGSKFSITLSGTTAADITQDCTTVYLQKTNAISTPENYSPQTGNYSVYDTNYDPYDSPSGDGNFYGNNGFQLSTQIYFPGESAPDCAPTLDTQVHLDLYDDEARTQLNNDTFSFFKPKYFKLTTTSLPPSEEAITDEFGFITAPEPYWNNYYYIDDLKCEATPGSTCPTILSGGYSLSGGNLLEGGTYTFTGSVKPEDPGNKNWQVDSNSKCVVHTSQTNTMYFQGSTRSKALDGSGSERTFDNNYMNRLLTNTDPSCQQGLAINTSPGIAWKDGSTSWTSNLSNTTQNSTLNTATYRVNLNSKNVKEITDFTCDALNGATCPTGTPEVKVDANGLFYFEITWGNAEAPAFPPGSSLNIGWTAVPSENKDLNIYFITTSLAGVSGSIPWKTVTAYAGVGQVGGSQLGATKTTNSINPKPGEQYTYTVTAINDGKNESPMYVNDTLPEGLKATNPAGFANITCRPITQEDNIFSPGTTVNEAPCPTFTTDATGLSGGSVLIPGNSGWIITYTAIAPLKSSSVANIVNVSSDNKRLTSNDALGQANIFVQTVDITGTVWHDSDSSAKGTFTNIKTGDESGTDATGLKAVLTDNNGLVIAVANVNDDGTYTFTGAPVNSDLKVLITDVNTPVAAGDIFTTPITPATWQATTPLIHPVTTQTKNVANVDFGVVQPGALTGVVYTDNNINGSQNDGETGIEGVTLTLTKPDGTKATTTTDATGAYSFDNLLPGDYTVTITTPEGKILTQVYTVSNPAGITTTTTGPASVTEGNTTSKVDFGLAALGGLSGTVYLDNNANGDLTSGEAGVKDVTLTLTLPDGSTKTTVTDENGKYLFSDLPPGDYKVTLTTPEGYTVTQVYTVSDPKGITNLTTDAVPVPVGATVEEVDFGLVQSNVKVNVCLNTADCALPLVGDTVSWNGEEAVTGGDGSWSWNNVTPNTDGTFSVTVPAWATVTEVWIDGVKQPTTTIPANVLSPGNGTVEITVVLEVTPVATEGDTPKAPVFESGIGG